jgi:hypothetical protein
MNIAILAAAIGISQGAAVTPPADVTYRNEWIGVSISHPPTWKVVEKKSDAWITIPLKEGTSHAGMSFVAATFGAEPDIWQKSQEHANGQLGFEVLRQWKEEILGVPLLLTKIRSGPGKLTSAIKAVPELPSDQPLVTLIGLVYSRTPRKLLFRLSAPENAYDEAEFVLRKALESLRTLDGSIPQPEDPSKPETAPTIEKPVAAPVKMPIGMVPGSEKPKFVRAAKVHEVAISGKKVGLYFPEGWTLETAENGAMTLKSADPAIALAVTVSSTLDSDPAVRALIKASAESLKDFEKVVKREENYPKENRAGNTYIRIWRSGEGKSGKVWSFEGVGGTNDFYFLVKNKGVGDLDASMRKAVEALLDQMSVEPIG